MPTTPLFRPEPVLQHDARPIDRHTPARVAAAKVHGGLRLIVTDDHRTGIDILDQLATMQPRLPDDASYGKRQAAKRIWDKTAARLLAPVVGHRLPWTNAPSIGFLAELYPEVADFALPFQDVLDLWNAWDPYDKGLTLAVLGHPIHPFYGTYVPTRTTHLELFATWLSGWSGPKGRAIDVGTGCGVLAMMLARKGFGHVLATDTNPNAVLGVQRDLSRMGTYPQIEVRQTDLLGEAPEPVDLVVFNPPWTRGPVDTPLHQALHFDDDLMPRFFDQAHGRLTPEGRVVLVFSNVITLVQPDVPHPILKELTRGRFREVQRMHRKVKPTPGQDGRRRITRERVEVWELALA